MHTILWQNYDSMILHEVDLLVNELGETVFDSLKLWEPLVIGKVRYMDPNMKFDTLYKSSKKSFPNSIFRNF